MVYLLHAYFGRDGREEAEALLQRNSGSDDSPRILGAFNEETPDWLSFFMFTYFTDRDGKYQLGTLKESAFDPLSRTCEFMLKEEAHHMFVGTTGVDRVVERTAELMREHDTDDVAAARRHPARRDPEVHQLPLLGLAGPVRLARPSTNAANYFTAGLKGRWQEERRKDDHLLTEDAAHVDAGPRRRDRPPTRCRRWSALNHDLRTRVHRRLPERAQALEPDPGAGRDRPRGCRLPHVGFNRQVGLFAGHHVTPDGRRSSAGRVGGEARTRWLPTEARQDPRALADAPGLRAAARSPPGSPRRARASTASRSTTSTSIWPNRTSTGRGGSV